MTESPAPTTCAFHPDRETLLACTRCDRPCCPDCLVSAAVGMHCRECVGEQAKAAPAVAKQLSANRRRMTRPGVVFWLIAGGFLGLCVLLANLEIDTFGDVPGDVRLTSFLTVVAGWILSLCFHEWAHAFTAFKAGDHSVLSKGYLTLDPRKYADPVFSVALPIAFLLMGGIGLPGGAVWIDRGNIRSRHHQALVSAAGPATNVVFGVLCLLFAKYVALEQWPLLGMTLVYLAWIEFLTAALNLLPVPGLDGYGIVEPYLPHGVRVALAGLATFAILILLVLLISTDALDFLFDIADAAVAALGVDTIWVSAGQFIGQVRLL